jgi:hypothetical protein
VLGAAASALLTRIKQTANAETRVVGLQQFVIPPQKTRRNETMLTTLFAAAGGAGATALAVFGGMTAKSAAVAGTTKVKGWMAQLSASTRVSKIEADVAALKAKVGV